MSEPAVANQSERERWNDPRWVDSWPDREELTSSVTPSLITALDLRAGESVLEIGCGGGRTTIEIAKRVAPGAVIGWDLSDALTGLARARAEEAGVSNVEFVIGDAQVDPIPGGPFDAVCSQFGIMFFDDREAAFKRLHGMIRPGGRLVFVCWQPIERNPWHTVGVLAPFVADRPPQAPVDPGAPPPPGPFSMGDTTLTAALLEGAGFTDIDCTEINTQAETPASAIWNVAQLDLNEVPEENRPAALEAIDAHLARFDAGGGLYRPPIAYAVWQATA